MSWTQPVSFQVPCKREIILFRIVSLTGRGAKHSYIETQSVFKDVVPTFDAKLPFPVIVDNICIYERLNSQNNNSNKYFGI